MGRGDSTFFVTQHRQIYLHLLFAVQFEQLFQLQFIILKRGLCRDQLIAVGADLCFQLGIVAPGDASRIQQLLAAVPLGFGYLQGVFVHLHRLGRIQYLYVGLGDGLPDVILRSSHVEVRHPVVSFSCSMVFRRLLPLYTVHCAFSP